MNNSIIFNVSWKVALNDSFYLSYHKCYLDLHYIKYQFYKDDMDFDYVMCTLKKMFDFLGLGCMTYNAVLISFKDYFVCRIQLLAIAVKVLILLVDFENVIWSHTIKIYIFSSVSCRNGGQQKTV